MKLAQYNFTKQELDQAKQRLANGSEYIQDCFHPEDDAKTERELLAECAVIEANVRKLQAS
jgi:hypothetical protein